MTQKAIGPTFSAELAAAGVVGQHVAWRLDGTIEFFDDTPDAVRSTVLSVYAAHDPEKTDPNKVYRDKVAAGLGLSSTTTPALNAVYAIDVAASHNISSIAAGIASRGRLPGGGSTFHYADSAGEAHEFSAANFLDFAAAVEDYTYALAQTRRTLVAGGSAEWPSPDAIIA